MKKFKLIKELKKLEVGEVYEESYIRCIFELMGGELSKEWFEEVKEFEKQFYIGKKGEDQEWLMESFISGTGQAEAEKALKEHIYKLPEPDDDANYYTRFNFDWLLVNNDYDSEMHRNNYRSGEIINESTTEGEREKRIRLLKEVNKY